MERRQKKGKWIEKKNRKGKKKKRGRKYERNKNN